MILCVQHLTAYYKKHGEKRRIFYGRHQCVADNSRIEVLSDVSFSIKSGEVTALAGANGSGKSTLLSIMAGISKVSHPSLIANGGASYDGTALSSMKQAARARIVSFMAQSEASVWDYSALEVVMMARYAHTLPCGQRLPLVHCASSDSAVSALDALSLAGAADLADRGVKSLSGGQWQRVRLARAIAQGAPFMILDEPGAGLDMGFRDEFFSILKTLSCERGIGVLFSTHDVNTASRHCSRMAFLFMTGRLESGSVQEMMTSKKLSLLYGHNILTARHPELGIIAYAP